MAIELTLKAAQIYAKMERKFTELINNHVNQRTDYELSDLDKTVGDFSDFAVNNRENFDLTAPIKRYKTEVTREIEYDYTKEEKLNCDYILEMFGKSWYNLFSYNKSKRQLYITDLYNFVKVYEQTVKPARLLRQLSQEDAKKIIDGLLKDYKDHLSFDNNFIRLTTLTVDIIKKAQSIGYGNGVDCEANSIYENLKSILNTHLENLDSEKYEEHLEDVAVINVNDEVSSFIKMIYDYDSAISSLKSVLGEVELRAESYFERDLETEVEWMIHYSIIMSDIDVQGGFNWINPRIFLSFLVYYFTRGLSEVGFSHLVAYSYLDNTEYREIQHNWLLKLEFMSVSINQYVETMRWFLNMIAKMEDLGDNSIRRKRAREDFHKLTYQIFRKTNYLKVFDEDFLDEVVCDIGVFETEFGTFDCTIFTYVFDESKRKEIEKGLKWILHLQFLQRNRHLTRQFKDFIHKYTLSEVMNCIELFEFESTLDNAKNIIINLYEKFD